MLALNRFREKMAASDLAAFLVTQPHNRRYLSGFTGSAGVLLVTPAQQFLATDSRYYERVKAEAPDWTLIEAGYQTTEKLAELLPQLNLVGQQVGFEADHVTVSQLNSWREKFEEIALVETSEFVLGLRAVKTADEIAAIRKAVALADRAMSHIYDSIQPGMTEKEVAWELEVFMRTQGASALSFETIVAAGPNGAAPHASASDYQIQYGDPVVIDMGCVVEGYCSDVTRSFSLGRPKYENYREIWQLVQQANVAAAEGIKAGMPGDKADALARDVIKAAGYGDYFGHSLGHGVGLAIHEYPRLSYATEAPVEAGGVVTIEPGVYLPGAFGVRLEDLVIITDDGVEVVTGVPKIDVLDR